MHNGIGYIMQLSKTVNKKMLLKEFAIINTPICLIVSDYVFYNAKTISSMSVVCANVQLRYEL